MENIFLEIATMRKGMKAIGCDRAEIEAATRDVQAAEDYKDALNRINKYWK